MNSDFDISVSYKKIMDGNGVVIGTSFDVNYAKFVYNIYKDAERYVKVGLKVEETNFVLSRLKNWENQIIVDLGAGSSKHGLMLADVFKAKAYIGVEPFFYNQLERNLGFMNTKIPCAVEREHMRSFLRRLPDDSVSVFVSGIDDAIVDNDDYLTEVASEITRVLHPKGLFLSHGSNVCAEGFIPESLSYDGINNYDFYFK